MSRSPRAGRQRYSKTMRTPWRLVACGLMWACGGEESCPDIACRDTVRIAFDPPLSQPGLYRFVFTNGVSGSCELHVPAQTAECSMFHPERGADGALLAFSFEGAPRNVTLSIKYAGRDLLATDVTPRYRSSGGTCTSGCEQGSAVIDTTRAVYDGSSGAGGAAPMGVAGHAGAAGSSGASGTGGTGMAAACDTEQLTGEYTVTYEAVTTTCPPLGSQLYALVDGVEMIEWCTVADLSWSADYCTRTSTLHCADSDEPGSYSWDLVLTQQAEDGSILQGTGTVRSTDPACEGEYTVTFTRNDE